MAEDLRSEALNVTWGFEAEFFDDAVREDPRVARFPPPTGGLTSEQDEPNINEGGAFAVIRIMNNNTHVIDQVQIALDHPHVDPVFAGVQRVGRVHPGESRFWIYIHAGGSETSWEKSGRRLLQNEYATWLEFVDSRGNRWRRHAGGKLESLGTDLG